VHRNIDEFHGLARLLWPALALALALTALAPKTAHGTATQCTMIVPEGPREVMINICNACRTIDILRKRPGNDVPVQRTFTLPPGSRLQVPFLGPGRSRITSELPCPGEPGAAENLVEPPKTAKKQTAETCVSLERAAAGVALINRCGGCRAALIERVNGPNGGNEREAFKLAPRTSVEVPANGFAQVGLVGDIDCP
jgi:hypothetical protein